MLRFIPLLLSLMACEAKDNFDSELTCTSYCTKTYDCQDVEPTATEQDECIASCRNSIEDECGNDNQAAANDKVNECVDLACDEFTTCMVFEAAPECFGFLNP